MSDNYDAIIIGGGPAGATAGILLARQGWRVALVEKVEFPRRKVCGECVAASNFPLLDSLGVGAEIRAHAGPPLRQVGLIAGAQMIRGAFPPYADDQHAWGRAVGREVLDSALMEQARKSGVTTYQPWMVRDVQGAPGRFTCKILAQHGGGKLDLSAPVLVAAHGSWEIAPTANRKRQPPMRDSDLFAFKANFSHTQLEPGVLPVVSFDGGYGGMVIGSEAMATFAFCIRRDVLVDCRKTWPGVRAAEAAAAHVAASCPGVGRLLAGAGRQEPWLSIGPIRPGIRIPRGGGQMFQIGNAAGEAHPIIGEGMSMAIQSACLLAARLGRYHHPLSSRDHRRALQDYAVEWRRAFSSRIQLAALFAHIAMRPALLSQALPVVRRFPQLLTEAARWSGKVRCPPVQNMMVQSA